jgi:hypothetical protein
MRTSMLLNNVLMTTVMAAAVAAPCAMAGQHSTTTVSDFSWSADGQALSLHSQTGSAVVVTHATPEPFHGLRAGDRLLAADGKPLHQVEDLTRLLRGRTRPLELRVQRGQRLTTLVWSQADYRAFAPSDPPPAPPPLPAPPAPHF